MYAETPGMADDAGIGQVGEQSPTAARYKGKPNARSYFNSLVSALWLCGVFAKIFYQ
jgi:hypothetical protein